MSEIVKYLIDNTSINLLNDFEQLDMLLARGGNLVIPQQIIDEYRSGPRTAKIDRFDAWLSANSMKIETPNFDLTEADFVKYGTQITKLR